MTDVFKKYIGFLVFSILFVSPVYSQLDYDYKPSTPFAKKLPAFKRPGNPNPPTLKQVNQYDNVKSVYVNPDDQTTTYIYKPKNAFTLVVSQDEYPVIDPGKDVYGIVSLVVYPGYKAKSRVIYMKEDYRFDRLSWAIKTGWNETIPFFSRLESFKQYLEPFDQPVYAHFYIMDVKEYPEYPGQYYHWPREALEGYYLYILQKIDSVASQN